MANYGMRDLGAVHGAGQRIITMRRPYSEAVGLGKRIGEGMTGAEILRATETDFEVQLSPVQTMDGRPVPSTFAVRRTDTGEPFGNGRCVGSNYRAYQNAELVAFGESLVDAADGNLKFEAGGYQKGGAIVWYQARIPHSVVIRANELGEDRVQPYLFLLTSHDGTMSTTAKFTANRLWCDNQIAATLRGRDRVTVRHTRSMGDRLAEAQRVLRVALGFFEQHAREMRELDQRAMSLDEMRRFAEELIGETQEAIAESERTIGVSQHRRRVAQRDRMVDLFRGGLGNVGRSRLDALNAVTEFEDHHRVARDEGSRLRRLVLAAPEQDAKVRALRLLSR